MDNEYDKRNGNVVFKEDSHKYWDLTNPTAPFISVTTLIERFAQPFNKEFWSMYKALEKLIPKEDWKTVSKPLRDSMKIPDDIYNMYDFTKEDVIKVQQDILDEWQKTNQESCERGTKIHAELENSFYKMGANCNLQKFGIGGKFICDKGRTTLDLEDGVYPEYLISRVSEDGVLRLAGQIDLLVKKGHHYVIIDHKGLPLDTPILTSKGWSTMEDLKVGDKVFDKDGNLCNVTVKSEVHHNPCYRIKFDNHESIVADVDHRWLVSFKLQKPTKENPDGYKHRVMTTLDIKMYLDAIEKRTSYNIPKILNAKPLNLPKTDLPIDPYVLGAWLGDGSKACGVITQAKDSKLWEIVKQRGFELGPNLNHSEERKNVEQRTVYGLQPLLKKLGVLNNKHIPDIYLLASYEDRLQLLRGLMDTDGYFHPKRKRYVMTTSFDWQMMGMKQLLSSLGCKVSVFREIHKCDGKEFPGWNINFTTNNFNPFLCRNMEIKNPSIKNNNGFRNIESVEEVETVPTQCIAVDSPSHTYLCTHSLIVTHNTNSKIEKKGYFNSKTKSSAKMKFPLNSLEDSNYWHYNLQLSTYAWMIQKLDPEAVIDDLILNWYPHEGGNQQFHLEYLKKEVVKMLSYYKKQLLHQIQEAKYKEIEY